MAKKAAKATEPLQEIPPANEAEEALQTLLRKFDDLGVSMDETQWRKLTDNEQSMARVWVEARGQHGAAVIPIFLEKFAIPELVAELNATVAKAAERRILLMPCIFKNPGYEKLEDGSLVIVIKLRSPDSNLTERSARDFLGDKHVRVEVCRRPFGEWGQQEIIEDGDRRTISFECDITTYAWSDDHYKFNVRCSEDIFANGGNKSGLDEAINWAGKQGSIRLTVLGDIKGGEPPISGEAKRGPGRPKKGEAKPGEAQTPKAAKPIKGAQKLPGTDTDEKFNVALTANFKVDIRVFGAPESKIGCEWTGTGPAGSCAESEPSIRVSAKEAIVSSIGKAIDFWTSYSGDEERDVIADLRHWVGELEKGKSPKQIEAEMDDEDPLGDDEDTDVKF